MMHAHDQLHTSHSKAFGTSSPGVTAAPSGLVSLLHENAEAQLLAKNFTFSDLYSLAQNVSST